MIDLKSVVGLSAMLVLTSTAALADTFVVTIENPGVQSANIPALCAGNATCVIGTETFNARPVTGISGGAAFSTDFGTSGAITGAYAGQFGIHSPDDLGPAGGVGTYITTNTATGYAITLNHSAAVPGLNYFGFWLAGLDSGNELQVLRNGVIVGTYAPSDLVTAVGGNQGYFGNPNNGGDSREPFAFVNFFDTTGFFDEVRIFETPLVGGYESDNHTVGFRSSSTTIGTVVGAPQGVPEPASVALFGVGIAGLALARRRRPAR